MFFSQSYALLDFKEKFVVIILGENIRALERVRYFHYFSISSKPLVAKFYLFFLGTLDDPVDMLYGLTRKRKHLEYQTLFLRWLHCFYNVLISGLYARISDISSSFEVAPPLPIV